MVYKQERVNKREDKKERQEIGGWRRGNEKN
jgi:hypothetical protein